MDCPRQGTVLSAQIAQDRCQTCRGKGDFCEYCNKEELIFVFEFAKVARCQRCRGCFHQACAEAARLNADPRNCPRCQRIQLVKGQVPYASLAEHVPVDRSLGEELGARGARRPVGLAALNLLRPLGLALRLPLPPATDPRQASCGLAARSNKHHLTFSPVAFRPV